MIALASTLAVVGCSTSQPATRPDPPPSFGESCDEDEDCDAALACVDPVFVNPKCTYQCEHDWDCPEGTSCLSDLHNPSPDPDETPKWCD